MQMGSRYTESNTRKRGRERKVVLEFRKKTRSKNSTQMASSVRHEAFICSTVAKGWAGEHPSNKPRQSQRRINVIKWRGNVTACIRNLKTSDMQVPLDVGVFIIQLDVEFQSLSSTFLHLNQKFKG